MPHYVQVRARACVDTVLATYGTVYSRISSDSHNHELGPGAPGEGSTAVTIDT